MSTEGKTAAEDGLKERVVLVTGGSKGIGLACARRFQALGDKVAVTYRSSPPPDTSTDEPSKFELLPVPCDVTDPRQVEECFRTVEAELGPVEVLVANAGITGDTLILRMGEELWQKVIDTDLTGVYRVVKRAVGPMVKAHSGRIILISSVGGFIGSPGQANYCAAKAGLLGLARSLAREVASRKITVNVVAPGVVETDMTEALGEKRLGELLGMVPMARGASPDEVAAVVGFVGSEDASYITGAVIPVDGGLGMGM